MGLDKGSHKAATSVLNSIRKAKPHARNAVYRALHHAESSLAACLGMVRFPKRSRKSTKGRKATKRAQKALEGVK